MKHPLFAVTICICLFAALVLLQSLLQLSYFPLTLCSVVNFPLLFVSYFAFLGYFICKRDVIRVDEILGQVVSYWPIAFYLEVSIVEVWDL